MFCLQTALHEPHFRAAKPSPSFGIIGVRGVAYTCMCTNKPRSGGAYFSRIGAVFQRRDQAMSACLLAVLAEKTAFASYLFALRVYRECRQTQTGGNHHRSRE